MSTAEIYPVDLTELDDTEELLQTSLWGKFKQATGGWQPSAFRAVIDKGSYSEQGSSTEQDSDPFKFLILSRKVAGPFFLAYVPFGPVGLRVDSLGQVLRSITRLLSPYLPSPNLAVRWDLPVPVEAPLKSLPPLKRGKPVQVPDTVLIDLDKSEDKLLAEMERGHRYNVGYAERKGVRISEHGSEAVPRWYNIFQTTIQRDEFMAHPQSYYETFVRMMEQYQGRGQIRSRVFLATHEEDTLAGCIISVVNGRATYLYSASSNIKRNLKPVYLMLWRVMQWAKAQGCHTLDMCGIPSDPNPKHPLAGLYDFKRYFGGTIVHRAGSWDAPTHLLYPLFRMAESLR